jgi:NTP pyrophosphatase (non-canonical NTP hydrolase)
MIFGTITELGIHLADLVEDQADWSQATFGKDSERGPLGPLKHLEKEAREAQEAWERLQADIRNFAFQINTSTDKVKEELADCLLLVLDASRRSGIKVMQLLEAAQAKMKVNRAREWPKPTDAVNPVEHVK